MKHKKSLLALATFGIFAGVGLATTANVSAFTDYFIDEDTYREGENNMYYIDANKIDIECPSGAAAYKVDKDYDASKLTWFRADVTCTNISFDLNGKTVADGAITIPGGVTITLEDSVGGGSLQNSASRNHAFVDSIVNAQGYGDGATSKVIIKSGQYQGGFRGNGRSLAVDIEGGAFEDSNWDSTVNVAYTIQAGTFNNIMLAHNSDYGGQISISGGTFNNPTFSVRALSENGSTIGSISIRGGVFNNPTMDDSSKLLNLAISGGTFSERPDEKYLATSLHGKFVTYEVDGKYIVAEPFFIYAPSYIVKGEESEVTGTPAFLWDDAEITSSDESIVKILDSEREDGRAAFKFIAGKTGKATINFATTYESGSFDVYVDEISATNLTGEELQRSASSITSILNCLMKTSDFIPSCTGLAPVFRDKDHNAAVNKVADAFKAGHTLVLELGETGVELSADQINQVLEVAPGLNILRSGRYDIFVKDSVTKETLATEIPGIISVDVPVPLQDRTITVVGTYGDKAMVTNLKIEDDKMFFPAYYDSITILYDGDPISGKISKEDIPAVPNSAGFSDENSMAIILGASAALGLIIAVIAIYANGRKKALNKVRF